MSFPPTMYGYEGVDRWIADRRQPGGHWATRVLVPGTDDDVLTIAELKERARILPGDEESDTLLQSYIAAARVQVERDTGVAIPTQQIEAAFDRMPPGSAGIVTPTPWTPLNPVLLPMPPLQSIDGITWTGIDGEVVQFAPEDVASLLYVDAISQPARVWWIGGSDNAPLGQNASAFQPIKLQMTVGYAKDAIPPLLKFAVGLLATHFLTNARDRVIVGTSGQVMPNGYDEAIAAYRVPWVI